MRYDYLDALPHALANIISEIFLHLGYLQRVTTCYRKFFFLNVNIHFFLNLTVTRVNPRQNIPNPC